MSSSPEIFPQYTLAHYATWQRDWEMWQGVPVAMTPSPCGRHQWAAGRQSRLRVEEWHIVKPPRLIAEVLSPSTEEKDRTAERDPYASQSVAFCLIVDPIGKRIESFQMDSVTGGFTDLSGLADTDTMEFPLAANCVAKLDLASLFRI